MRIRNNLELKFTNKSEITERERTETQRAGNGYWIGRQRKTESTAQDAGTAIISTITVRIR